MIGKIERFVSLSAMETKAACQFMVKARYFETPLSGYLAGKLDAGQYVRGLEEAWCDTFGVKYAIACNSATSGLMAAAFAIDLGFGDRFVCPAMTMSATAAAPMFTKATPIFGDVSDEDFGLEPMQKPDNVKAIFTTNLFGHPSRLAQHEWDRSNRHDRVYLIEDNAQSPFAMSHGGYAGTVGDIGVWSLNVHKPLQCGEGGIVTTNEEHLALAMRDFINHGEVGGELGLNLRMPEICAVIAQVQLSRGQSIINGRAAQARAILAAIGDIPGLRPPITRKGCTHSYYVIPFLVERKRAEFCAALRAAGVPIVEGYQEPLYRRAPFKKFARHCPVAEDLQDRRLFYFENCAWCPNDRQIKEIGDAFKKAAETVL